MEMDLIKKISSIFANNFDYNSILKKLDNKAVEIEGLPGSSKALFLTSLFTEIHNSIFIIVKNNRVASNIYSDIKTFSNDDINLHILPSKETLPYDNSPPQKELTVRRIVGLNAMLSGEKAIFAIPIRSFIDYYMPIKKFKESILKFEKGRDYDYNNIPNLLVALGYERVDKVYEYGEFSVRGDIVDIFIPGYNLPVRIEFFDTEIESIRNFIPESQRSNEEINSVTCIPAKEFVIDEEVKKRVSSIANNLPEDILEEIINFKLVNVASDNFMTILYNNPSTLLDYVYENGKNGFIVFDSLKECRRQGDFYLNEAKRIYKENEDKYLAVPNNVIVPIDNELKKIDRYIDIVNISSGETSKVNFKILEKRGYKGRLNVFKEDVLKFLKKGYTVVIGANYEGQTERLKEILKDYLNKYKNLNIITIDLTEGFLAPEMKLVLILDREIFNRRKRNSISFLKSRSKPIEGIMDISEGDFIVHVEHGIGIYKGIEKLNSGGTEKDFIKIEYRDGDEIFIPVDQINLLQKYVGYQGRKPRIDKIGSDTWKKVKDHVKRSVKNLANELLEIYSIRESLKGHAFSKDTEWQYEFESGFKYEETPDQIRTIQEVKKDMEDEKPMDRLICGDVGFGKTEVAIRAAFKAVMDGKQVAVLVPTTILAEQHLNTFKERFALYPVNIEMLSRFRTHKEQKQIIENLKNGLIDIVIGTHRLIQKDVQFKDLGLVIIDEEQRFGVEHKERFKQLRKLVDVITMTATPIPRTLYMSMTQIRDMSIIETPPQDRVPIETYVVAHNDDVIVQAIKREIERGGQVYYVHNRIKTIDERAEYLRKLMPDISFEIAHGRMDEDELEQVMKSFFDMEFQVLVSTTIIESGLDIPNVNTIIIERADRFGLAQLYQLRGRVGRSSRKAYAYLLYPPERIIGEKAEKRLSVINDYTELGSGFAIAMKDLEIRGAGNILGREQHGDILAVGFEMYVKLLDEAIKRLKEGEAYQEEIEPVLDLKYRGYIPENFIQSEKLRIEIYKRLASVRHQKELALLIDEIKDRFSEIPEPLENLIDVVKIRILCKDVGIRNLREKENEIQITFEKSRVNILALIQKINKNRKIFSISAKNYNTLHVYKVILDNKEKYEFLKELFDYDENAESAD